MHLRDNTAEVNSQGDMANYYLYHSESPAGAYGVAVEQAEADVYNVSVLFKEPGWDMFGVLRYWTFGDRAEAEANYLSLQKAFEGIDEAAGMKEVLKALPEEQRHGPRSEG
jgi:hypothetical protein